MTVHYRAVERSVVTADRPQEGEAKATAHYRLMEGDPVIESIDVLELVPAEQGHR